MNLRQPCFSRGARRLASLCAGAAILGCLPSASAGGALAAPQATPVSSPRPVAVSAVPTYREIWGEGTVHSGWQVVWNGYGTVVGDGDRVTLRPAVATAPDRTHSALVASVSSYGDAVVETTMSTQAQLRTGSAPNPWEVAWLLTRYQDSAHFYALALKPNGWELSKQDPAYPGGQRFLATGTLPAYPVGSAHSVRLTQTGPTLAIVVDGRAITTFRDTERPYLTGKVGLYTEDAVVTFVGTKAVAAAASTPTTPAPSPALFAPMPPADGLVTNEWAFWNPQLAQAVRSTDWEMTSGSLFARGGSWWTGVPDDRAPDARSTTGTNSAVFRLTSRRNDLRDVAVDMTLTPGSMTSTPSTPPVDWDGTHLFLRYQSEESLYYASVARRDGHVVLKKKCAGGPSNGGTYVTLAESSGHALTPGTARKVGATVRSLTDGSVELTVRHDGATILRAVDVGTLCAPITAPGRVGVRGDNADFLFRDFRAS